MKKFFSWILLIPIYFYRACISPLKPPTCRFVPTCSEYAIQAIKKYGPLKGTYLAIKRILHCHPWGGSGYDPVP
ncbi:membrane protein insertion efficiency factor YidD [Coprobacter secundus]|uniref:Putative membrane protein insertion efficiency factor n=1 Tax=Coprobacter secundus subsp. similis TaxID=2751153 RepID=A0A7G1I350_9BACT|nr:membrane protein insertion efficiency factor YidD [Coprobacter secundus]BCI63987.1 putative membrane protein insertion efficiency factor [Coprobacter secundus subsp. similis]